MLHNIINVFVPKSHCDKKDKKKCDKNRTITKYDTTTEQKMYKF